MYFYSHTTTIVAFSKVISFEEMTSSFFSFLPKLLGAALVLIVGYVIAKVVRDLLTLVLRMVKVDEFQAKASDDPMTKNTSENIPDSIEAMKKQKKNSENYTMKMATMLIRG